MSIKINIIHKFKFTLWYISKKNPILGFPIKILGKISTINFMKNYKNKLKRKESKVLPDDRYERNLKIPKQFYIIKSYNCSDLDEKSVKILLNHFRIPFTLINLSDVNLINNNSIQEPFVLIGIKLTNEEISEIKKKLINKICKIIIFSKNNLNNIHPDVDFITNNPEEMMPSKLGLRSKIVEKFTYIILNSNFLIVTGFLPAQIALRIDDVVGSNKNNYINKIINHKWIPNLGIFLNKFKESKNIDTISSLNKENKVLISPHAYDDKTFLFYDYPNGCSFSKSHFEEKWSLLEKEFDKLGLKISSIVNAHFHAFSKENFELFNKKGIKYIFSELSPGNLDVVPDNSYLPSGDPINTTGQINNNNIYQIYSGDSVLDCNQKKSNYDFLMHLNSSNKTKSALNRIKERLNLSLNTGFASFFTTHEYLISQLTENELSTLFNEIDNFIINHKLNPTKSNLYELGRACENHTNIIIYSIEKNNEKYVVNLKGKSNGDFYLSCFLNGKINKLKFSSFEGNKKIEINI